MKKLTTFFLFIASCSFAQKQTLSVYFDFNQYTLNKNAISKIDSALQNNKIQYISLCGHCDSIGTDGYNDALSSKRVLEVKKHILSKNISDSLIQISALGKRVALNKNQTETERALNRRVEMEIIFKTTETKVTFKGIVLNELNKPIVSEISLNDQDGNEIAATTSGPDGKYSLDAILLGNNDYTLQYYNKESFISSKVINRSNPEFPFQNLITLLPKLKAQKKYKLQNLNFEGDTSQLIPKSKPSLEALYKLLKNNASLVIRIEGHINYPKHWGIPKNKVPKTTKGYPAHMDYLEFNQWLSEQRAKTVYNYLIAKGISPNRLSTIGYGASKMLFPNAVKESEQEDNRRVEINVISFK